MIRSAHRLALILFLLLFAAPASAHTGGTTGFATVTVQGQTVRYALTLGLGALEAAGIDPGLASGADYDRLAKSVAQRVTVHADGAACAAVPGSVAPPSPVRAAAIIILHYACGAPVRALTVRDDLFETFGGDYHSLLSVEGSEGRQQFLLQPEAREASVTLPRDPAADGPISRVPEAWLGFVFLGAERFLTGVGHLLFLLALIFGSGATSDTRQRPDGVLAESMSLFVGVAAFAAGHSLTILLSAAGGLALSPGLVAPLIAASVLYLATANILRRTPPRRRWVVPLLAGLVHGFGLATATPAAGIRELFGVAIGVIAGEAVVVAVLAPVFLWFRRFIWRSVGRVLSAVLLIVGAVLIIDRLATG